MLCHVLYHPLITMSSYVGRFLREYPVPNPWMMCNGVSQHGYGFQPTWQVPCRVESEFISNPRLQRRLVFEKAIPLNLSIAICCLIVLGLWFIIIKKWLACSSNRMQTSSVDAKIRLLFELCKAFAEKVWKWRWFLTVVVCLSSNWYVFVGYWVYFVWCSSVVKMVV